MKFNKDARVGLHECFWFILFDYFWIWELSDGIFKYFHENRPKMSPKVVVFPLLPWSPGKIMDTIGFLIVWNLLYNRVFFSGGLFDASKIRSKVKKKCHRRTPWKCPKGPPWTKEEESASHHFTLAVNRQPGNRQKDPERSKNTRRTEEIHFFALFFRRFFQNSSCLQTFAFEKLILTN